ncbi:MAG TPA: AsmA family protein [Steroidobacteraceae bacterium]|nr:AsmA family protein [Steroidobacteraceae bacterium]
MARHTRRLILWIIGSLLALALLAALAVVVLVFTIDPDRFRGRIETAATQALGRSVKLTGELHWRLGAHIGIESRGGEIANAPGFGQQPFAAWRSLRLQVAARPLLNKELHISRIEIEGLSLRLQRDAAGQGNWSFAPPTVATADSSQLRSQIDSLQLSDSSLRFDDAASGRAWTLDSLNLETGLPADLRAPVLDFAQFELSGRVHGAPLTASGVELLLKIPALRVVPSAVEISAPSWQLRWDETALAGSLQAAGGGAMPAAQGELKVESASLRRLLNTAAFALPATRDPKAFGALRLVTHWNYRDGGVALDAFDATLDDTHLQGTVALPRLSPLSLRFDLSADRLDVDRYLQPLDAKSEPFELPLAALRALDAHGTLRIRQATAAGATARELVLDVD